MKMKDYWLLQKEGSGEKAVESKAREKFAILRALTMLVKKNLEGAWEKEWKQEGRGDSELPPPLGTLSMLDGLCFTVEVALGSLFPEGWPGFAAQGSGLLGDPTADSLLCSGEQESTKSTVLPLEHSSAAVENYKGGPSPKKPRHLFWFSKHFINVIDNTSRFLRLACFYFWRVIPHGRLPSSASSLSILSIWIGRTHWSIAFC